MFDPQSVKKDFPLLARQVHDRPLVYLDNAATSHKPQVVIDAISNYYTQHNANAHRGVHTLSDESTTLLTESRQTIAQFLGATPAELILVRNTTEAINGVAYGWADHQLKKGDVILSSVMEHHSNLVVWQQAAARTGAKLELIQVTAEGQLDMVDLTKKLQQLPVKLVSLVHVSNALGTLNLVAETVSLVKQHRPQARVMLDAAQSVPHLTVNFRQLGVDFLAFSGHKMLGPMGSGGLLVRQELLNSDELKPWLFGGGMIAAVHQQNSQFHPDSAERFTAGTPDVASAVGLATACEYLQQLDMTQVATHDQQLVELAVDKLSQLPEVSVIGPQQIQQRVGSVAFIYDGVHAHDVAQVLDSQGIAVRSGHHCTMPLHQQFNWQATIRASFQVYNTPTDIDALVMGLEKVKTVFKK